MSDVVDAVEIPTPPAGLQLRNAARSLLVELKDPEYRKLCVKAAAAGAAVGQIHRRLGPDAAIAAALMTGVWLGIEMVAFGSREESRPAFDARSAYVDLVDVGLTQDEIGWAPIDEAAE